METIWKYLKLSEKKWSELQNEKIVRSHGAHHYLKGTIGTSENLSKTGNLVAQFFPGICRICRIFRTLLEKKNAQVGLLM